MNDSQQVVGRDSSKANRSLCAALSLHTEVQGTENSEVGEFWLTIELERGTHKHVCAHMHTHTGTHTLCYKQIVIYAETKE